MVCAAMTAKPAYRGPIVCTQPDGSQKIMYMPQTHRMPQQKEETGGKPNLAPKGLVILANFADVQFVTPRDTIDNMLNGAHFTRHYTYTYQPESGRPVTRTINSSGSARQYFIDQSYGQYVPVFDVIGPVTVSHEMEYYGADKDAKAGEMIKEACELADKLGVDFRLYDHDNDGAVDAVYVIYAGFGEADGGGENTIWPHQHNLIYTGNSCTIDGKRIEKYACGCEMNNISKVYDGIGTFCHEFSHVLGLPDMYETTQEKSGIHTLEQWDIMDYGPYNNDGNTPPSYSAYERMYMGWLMPRVLTEKEYVTLQPINRDKGESLLISPSNTHNLCGWDPDPQTFYMLEVRETTGWDAALPGNGMMLTRIMFNAYRWLHNVVNNNSRAQGIDIIEAHENTSKRAAASDLYPIGATEWTGMEGHEITNIEMGINGAICFSYKGAEKPLDEAIEEVEHTPSEVRKIWKNGQVVIVRGDKEYDILGRLL